MSSAGGHVGVRVEGSSHLAGRNIPYTHSMPSDDPNDLVVTPEMRAFIGSSTRPVTYQMRARDIAEFEAAISGELPDVTGDGALGDVGDALGTIVRTLLSAPFDPPFPEPFHDILDGGSEYEFHRPIRSGDSVTVVRTIKDVFAKQGRLGPMLFKVAEITYSAQDGALFATQRSTSISYGRPSKGTNADSVGV